MTAKRKTSQQKPTSRKADGSKKAAKLPTKKLDSNPSPKPSTKKSPQQREQTVDEIMMEFSHSLHEWPTTLETSPEFNQKWRDLLIWHAAKERDWLLKNSVGSKVVDRLIQLRWAVLDRARNAYDYLEKKPLSDLHPIPIIVVNWYGTWDLSPSLRATVMQHPIYRALNADLPEATPKSDLMRLMRWGMSLYGSPKNLESAMASLAHECDALIHDVDMFNSPNDEWLRLARQSEDFWTLLQKMFDFGRRHAFWQAYRDGSLQKTSRRGALMVTKGKGKWRQVLDEAIRRHYGDSGIWLSPAKLRKKLEALPDTPAPTTRLRFGDPELAKMPPITWGQLRSLAKKCLTEQKRRSF